ncbi:MAG TPA: hypothetical protein VMC43_01100 [Candidatus Paceibacterota bacterium]|nr:hypothetical protein [Candidatus Paceibacterota bacterium]
MTASSYQKVALVLALLFTLLFVKNIVVNIMSAHDLPTERVIPLLQY